MPSTPSDPVSHLGFNTSRQKTIFFFGDIKPDVSKLTVTSSDAMFSFVRQALQFLAAVPHFAWWKVSFYNSWQQCPISLRQVIISISFW